MTRLGGNFNVMMRISIPNEGHLKLVEGREKFNSEQGFEIHLHKAFDTSAKSTKLYKVRLSGADQSGVLYRVSSLFKERKINIHELEAWTEDAPFSGRLFKMVATVELPSESNITQLSADIDDLATKVGVDMWLET